MAAEILNGGIWADGEQFIDTTVVFSSTNEWQGGQPAALNPANGGAFLCKGSSNAAVAAFVGFFKNAYALDIAAQAEVDDAAVATSAAPENTTILMGVGKLRLFVQGTDTAPFVSPPTGGATSGSWSTEDEVFINVNGLLDNAAANSGDEAVGRVVAVIGGTTGIGAGPSAAPVELQIVTYGMRPTAAETL